MFVSPTLWDLVKMLWWNLWNPPPPLKKLQTSSGDGNRLTDAELKVFRSGHCPDCGGGLLTGPSGGTCINYICSGPGSHGDTVPEHKRSRFNDTGFFGVDRIGDSRCQMAPETACPHCKRPY